MDGGRDRDRTCDPFGVKDQCINQSGGTLGAAHFVPVTFSP
jgi:hypothetical protein